MRPAAVFKCLAGASIVLSMTIYTQNSQVHGMVVLLMGLATFLTGFFAGDDY